MKSTLNRISSRRDTVEIKISDLKATAIENIKIEIQGGKKRLGWEGLTEPLSLQRSNITYNGILEGDGGKRHLKKCWLNIF